MTWQPKSDPGTSDWNEKNWDTIDKEKQRFLTRINECREKGLPYPETLHGVYGPEDKGCDGYVEEVIRPKEGGTFVKIYGCSYLFKGYASEKTVHGIQLAKSFLSTLPRDILAKSWLYSAAIALRFVFQRNKFWYDLDKIANELEYKVIRWYNIPEKEYNEFGRELYRAVPIVIYRVFEVQKTFVNPDYAYIARKSLPDFILRIARLVFLFLEVDNTYRFRIQDAFSNDFWKFLKTLISRENKSGIGAKWKFIMLAMKIGFFLSPNLKLFITELFKELNPEKIKMDESDWYFALKTRSYNYGGKSQEERYAERERIDKEKGHIFLI